MKNLFKYAVRLVLLGAGAFAVLAFVSYLSNPKQFMSGYNSTRAAGAQEAQHPDSVRKTVAKASAPKSNDDKIPPKASLLADVDHAVTPERFEGNPSKYKNRTVQFTCRVVNVLPGDEDGYHEANATCSSGNTTEIMQPGWHVGANIVLAGKNVGNFDAGDTYKVLGFTGTEDGKTAMGADKTFAVVLVDYAE